MARAAFAIHAHPDDIEFMMAGTLFLLRDTGWEVHYMTIADGNCGSMDLRPSDTALLRREEAERAVEHLGGIFHPSLTHDMQIFYTPELLTRLSAVVREVAPDMLLIPSPEDYMEDHMNACRLAVGAAFTRGMPNYSTSPSVGPVESEVALYHAMPHGLKTALNDPVTPHFVVDISGVIEQKEEMLAQHRSQKEWLDKTQGFGSYLQAMREMSAAVGQMADPPCAFGEGWRSHSHLGFSAQPIDPLGETLGDSCRAV